MKSKTNEIITISTVFGVCFTCLSALFEINKNILFIMISLNPILIIIIAYLIIIVFSSVIAKISYFLSNYYQLLISYPKNDSVRLLKLIKLIINQINDIIGRDGYICETDLADIKSNLEEGKDEAIFNILINSMTAYSVLNIEYVRRDENKEI